MSGHAHIESLAHYTTARSLTVLLLESEPEHARQELAALLKRIAARLDPKHRQRSCPRRSFKPRSRWGPHGRILAQAGMGQLRQWHCKEQLLWVRSFADAEDVRRAVVEWIAIYNENWLIARHGYRSPAAVRRELLAVKASA